jgi:EAL domain-containing protein (putative c-di-GMP-specific phosphodiesterase class I)
VPILTPSVRPSNDAAIVRVIVGLSETLGLGVIAEGVEITEQRDFLLQAGCTHFQGYFYARPLPLGEFEELLPVAAAPALDAGSVA